MTVSAHVRADVSRSLGVAGAGVMLTALAVGMAMSGREWPIDEASIGGLDPWGVIPLSLWMAAAVAFGFGVPALGLLSRASSAQRLRYALLASLFAVQIGLEIVAMRFGAPYTAAGLGMLFTAWRIVEFWRIDHAEAAPVPLRLAVRTALLFWCLNLLFLLMTFVPSFG